MSFVKFQKLQNRVKQILEASAYPGTRENRVFPIVTGKESIQMVAKTLTALDSHDSTPMATGLWHAIHQICQANAERRLILMITDGAPDIDHHDPQSSRSLASVSKSIS